MEKLLIVGGSGLLGGHLARHAKYEFEVVATYHGHPVKMEGVRYITMDITHCETTGKAIVREKPDFIILTAAQRNVDYCEKHQDEVWKINVDGVKNVARASKRAGSRLIYLSTDLVFDGRKEHYFEDDETHPINHYGTTKLAGEKVIAEMLDDWATARVSVLYDRNPFGHTFNFVSWVFNSLTQGKPVSLFTDQYRNATYIGNVCDALLAIHKKDGTGLYHIAGKNCENRYEIGMRIAEVFGFDKKLISTATSHDSDWLAKRPEKCCLSVARMERELGIPSMSVEEGLKAMKREKSSQGQKI